MVKTHDRKLVSNMNQPGPIEILDVGRCMLEKQKGKKLADACIVKRRDQVDFSSKQA